MTDHDNLQSADVHQPSPTPSPTCLASVLSATSYPIPEPYISESNKAEDAETYLYGGILLSSCRQPPDDPPLSERTTTLPDSNTPQEKHQSNARSSPPAIAKRGRPRKIAQDQSGDDPEQHRRLQNRLAQRSYRFRKEANIAAFKTRILQLETAVQKMNGVVYLFSEELTKCEISESNGTLADRLHNIVEKYSSLAEKISLESEARPRESL